MRKELLVLVNREHRLPDAWLNRVRLVRVTNGLGRDFTLEEETAESFEALRRCLAGEGIRIELDSADRSVEEQQRIAEELAARYGAEYYLRYAAVPGFSEHHTGLALDICPVVDGRVIDDNEEMCRQEEIFARIHARLPEFGFILRYPAGKEAVTGYAAEPWHLRYVGWACAREMTERGEVLEEYLARKHPGEPAE